VERYVGKSTRSLNLGEDVDEDKVEASYVDGVLHVTLAKKSMDSTTKRIKTIEIH
jgi:HSP20 family molecular chaperone IbpA